MTGEQNLNPKDAEEQIAIETSKMDEKALEDRYEELASKINKLDST